MNSRISPLHLLLLAATALVFAWSARRPCARLTWSSKSFPGIVGADRLGHFAEGFVPALIARELFIRREVIRSRGWMSRSGSLFVSESARFTS